MPHDNKQLVTELFSRLSHSDIEGAMQLVADDVKWLITGNPERLPAAGLYDKARIRALLERMESRLQAGLQMTLKNVIAEGDHVAAEGESYGTLKNGRVYNQHYHFRVECRDGKVTHVREYLDTQHTFEVWFGDN